MRTKGESREKRKESSENRNILVSEKKKSRETWGVKVKETHRPKDVGAQGGKRRW